MRPALKVFLFPSYAHDCCHIFPHLYGILNPPIREPVHVRAMKGYELARPLWRLLQAAFNPLLLDG